MRGTKEGKERRGEWRERGKREVEERRGRKGEVSK